MPQTPRTPETADPVAALKAKSIHERAAATRDLSWWGTTEHLPMLIVQAHKDTSPAVRLGCASAASDILSRLRLPPHADTLSLTERRGLVDHLRGFDPAVNSGLFPIIACLGLPELFPRIAAGLRDPRGDVRVGAAVGLLRMVSSAAVNGDELMEQRVIALLNDSRLPADALAAVAQVCAAVDYRSAIPRLSRLNLNGANGDAVDEALNTFEEHQQPLQGLWLSDGRDAGEVNPDAPQGHGFAIVTTAAAVCQQTNATWTLQPNFSNTVRRMRLRRVGEAQPTLAIQHQHRTFYAATAAQLMDHLEQSIAHHPPNWSDARDGKGAAVLGTVADLATPWLEDNALGLQTLGQLRAMAGDLPGATAALKKAITQEAAPPSAWLFLGEALFAQGDRMAARKMWRACHRRAPSATQPHAVRAKARLKETS